MTRGYGFKLQHLLLVPLRDLLSLAMWARGATMRTVNWRGNRLRVLAETRLANAETIATLHKRIVAEIGEDPEATEQRARQELAKGYDRKDAPPGGKRKAEE